MAKGRFLSKSISQSQKFAALESNDHRMLYLLLLAHTDREGRLEADPRILSGMVLTLLDVPASEIQDALADMHRVGLIKLYRVRGQQYVEITGFLEHNTPHPREADSKIPPPDEGETGEKVPPEADPGQTQGEPKADLGSTQGGDGRKAVLDARRTQGMPKADPRLTLGEPKADLRLRNRSEVEVEEEAKEPPPTPPTVGIGPPPTEAEVWEDLTNENPLETLRRTAPDASASFEELAKIKTLNYRTRLAQARTLVGAVAAHGPDAVASALRQALDRIGDLDMPFAYALKQLEPRSEISSRRVKTRTRPVWDVSGGDRQNQDHPDYRPVRGQAPPTRVDQEARTAEVEANDRRNTLAEQARQAADALGLELN